MLKTKKMLSTLLAFALTFSLFSSLSVASATGPESREVLLLPYEATVTHPIYECEIDVTIYYSERAESSNASGSYIAAIHSGKVTDFSGWHSVNSSVTIGTPTYASNHQIAYVPITYYASLGEGNLPYNDVVTISLL